MDITELVPYADITELRPCDGITELRPRDGITELRPRDGITEPRSHTARIRPCDGRPHAGRQPRRRPCVSRPCTGGGRVLAAANRGQEPPQRQWPRMSSMPRGGSAVAAVAVRRLDLSLAAAHRR